MKCLTEVCAESAMVIPDGKSLREKMNDTFCMCD